MGVLQPVACMNCFSNWGFKQVVLEYSDVPEATCLNCGRSGPLITTEQLSEALVNFFVQGTYITETITPFYQINRSNQTPSRFDATLNADAMLACSITGEVIFNYGPPLWRVGEVDLKREFDEGGTRRLLAAKDLVAQTPVINLPAGTLLFRIRKNPKRDETIWTADAFDPPPAHIARSPGRWDNGTTSVLYASDDIELCLHECQVLIADEIVVAALKINTELRLIDLSGIFANRGSTPFDDPQIFATFLSLNKSNEWLDHARAVASAAQSLGFDGIRYTSYYAQAKHKTQALNVAIFDNPIKAGKVTIDSINRIRLTNAFYEFSLGPVLYDDPVAKDELEAALEFLRTYSPSGTQPQSTQLP